MSAHRKFLLGTALLLLNVLITQQRSPPGNYTKDTLRIAKGAEVLAYMDKSVDYCDNFYQYACGKWSQLHPPSEQSPKTSFLDRLQSVYEIQALRLLEQREQDDLSYTLDIKNFFSYCKDINNTRMHGFGRILEVADFKGGWPNITSETWYEHQYDWLKVVANLRRQLGSNILIGVHIVPDIEKDDRYRILLDSPELGLKTRENYQDPNKCTEYKESIENKLRAYFPFQTATWAKEVAQQVIDVEQILAKGLPDQNSKPQLNEVTLTELKKEFGKYIDLDRYLRLVFNTTIYVPVYNVTKAYLPELVELVKSTPNLTIANYTMWRVLNQFDLEAFSGQEIDNDEREIYCVREIIKYFPKQLEAMFYHKRGEIANHYHEVFESLKQTLIDDFRNSTKFDWATRESRDRAVSKLLTMDLEFDVKTDKPLKKEMEDLVTYGNEYISHTIGILKWFNRRELNKLVLKPQPELAAPRYDNNTNIIYLPVSYLVPYVLWVPEYPTVIKYATIGTIIGRQLVRGFYDLDSKVNGGYKVPYDGTFTWVDLWDEKSRSELAQRYKCFRDQYTSHSKYQGKPVLADGLLQTAIEDNAAVSLAYRTFLPKLVEELGESGAFEDFFPLTNYPKFVDYHLFFLIYAHINCASYHSTVDAFIQMPEELRVNLAVSNSAEFAHEFRCAAGKQMNPKQQCELF